MNTTIETTVRSLPLSRTARERGFVERMDTSSAGSANTSRPRRRSARVTRAQVHRDQRTIRLERDSVGRCLQGSKRTAEQRRTMPTWKQTVTTVSALRHRGPVSNRLTSKDNRGRRRRWSRPCTVSEVETTLRAQDRTPVERLAPASPLGRWWRQRWCSPKDWAMWQGRRREDVGLRTSAQTARVSGLQQGPRQLVQRLSMKRATSSVSGS